VRLLHISDLHYTEANDVDRSKIVAAATRDLSTFASDVRFDAIVFSGDLVFSGGDPGAFEAAFDRHLLPLADSLEVGLERLALLPGNHDIDRNEVNVQIESGLARSLASVSDVNEFIDASSAASIRNARLANFYQFVDSVWSDDAASSVEHLGRSMKIAAGGTTIGISCANSAWRATGSPDGKDKGHLLVGERQLTRLRSAIEDCKIRIFSSHHPPDWLADFDEQLVERELAGHYDLALFGHTHSPKPYAIRSELGDINRSTVGSLYQDASYRNSYSVVDIDPDSGDALFTYRAYSAARDEFAPDTEMSDDGTFAWTIGSRLTLREASPVRLLPTRVDVHIAVKSQLAETLSLLQEHSGSSESRLELLISPSAYRVREDATRLVREDGSRPPKAPIDEWMSSSTNVVIYGSKESGKTSALVWCLNMSLRATGRMPIAFDLKSVPPTRRRIIQAIRGKLLAVGIRTMDDLTDAPPLAIGIDNCENDDDSRLTELASVASEIQAQLILSATEPAVALPMQTPTLSRFVGESCHLGEYGTREMRTLAEQIYPDSPHDWDAIVRAAVHLMLSQGVERSPWACVLVLLLYRHEPQITEIDTTVLVDKYLDLVLGKWETDIDTVSGINHFNRRHFVVELAAEYDRAADILMTDEDVVKFASNYRSAYSLDFDPRKFIDDLYRRRVLAGSADDVHFALDGLQQFLVALSVGQGLIPLQQVLDSWEEYFEAIVHCCALSRDRKDIVTFLLGEVSAAATALGNPVSAAFTSIGDDVWGEIPELDETRRALARIGDEAGTLQSREHRELETDRMLDERRGQEPDDSGTPAVEDEQKGAAKLLGATGLLSLCLQRSEYVAGEGFKAGAVSDALASWARTYLALCAAFGSELSETRAERVKELEAIGVSRRQVEAFAEYGIFTLILGLAVTTIGSPKLRLTVASLLTSPTLDQEDLIGSLLLSVVAMSDSSSGWDDYLKAVIDRFGSRPHVWRLLRDVLAFRYCDLSVEGPELARVEDVCVHIAIANFNGDRERRSAESEIRQSLKLGRLRSEAIARGRADA